MPSAESRLPWVSPHESALKHCIDLRGWYVRVLGVDAIFALYVERSPKGSVRSRRITASVHVCVIALTVYKIQSRRGNLRDKVGYEGSSNLARLDASVMEFELTIVNASKIVKYKDLVPLCIFCSTPTYPTTACRFLLPPSQ